MISALKQKNCRLYLITPPKLDPKSFTLSLKKVLSADKSRLISALQIRQKNMQPSEIRNLFLSVQPVCETHKVHLIINDSPSLANDLQASGIHIGQNDPSYEQARKAVGKTGIVGMTCHNSVELAKIAEQRGANYVAFGSFFPTLTKKVQGLADPSTLETWKRVSTTPSVAIGGITPGNCHPLIKSGANFLAVISSFWEHPMGPLTALEEFKKAMI